MESTSKLSSAQLLVSRLKRFQIDLGVIADYPQLSRPVRSIDILLIWKAALVGIDSSWLIKLGFAIMQSWKVRYLGVGLGLVVAIFVGSFPSSGQGLPTTTWPSGTYLGGMDHGGRITTFHRGYVYLGGLEQTSVWDISDPALPLMVQESQAGENGHSWYKIGDLFWRQYYIPEHGDTFAPQFQDLSDPLNRIPWTEDLAFSHDVGYWHFLSTYPLSLGEEIWDVRSESLVASRNLMSEDGINANNSFRIGNLYFVTPGDEQTGVAVFDIGDPSNPVLLDILTGNYRQYTTAWQVWRNYIVLAVGDNENGPSSDANVLAIDFSDPTDLRLGFSLPYSTLPGRYIHFQDQYAFTGSFLTGHKVDMETGAIVETFSTPEGDIVSDFQWIPYGHLLLTSYSELGDSRTFLFAHQEALDTQPPTVGYHLPKHRSTNQPVSTVIGFVINETLNDTTIDDTTIIVRPQGGDPIQGTVISTQYDVINFTPEPGLESNTIYEVELVANGIHDVAGNGIEGLTFRFSTGSIVDPCLFCDGFEDGDLSQWN